MNAIKPSSPVVLRVEDKERSLANKLAVLYETVILAERDHREYAAAREALAKFRGPKLILPA